MDCKSWWDQGVAGGGSLEGIKAGHSRGDGQRMCHPNCNYGHVLLLAMARYLNSYMISVFKGLSSFFFSTLNSVSNYAFIRAIVSFARV